MINAVFWASLRREEGYTPTISAAFLPSEAARNPLLFEQPVPLVPEALSRLGPAVERPGIHFGVWRRADALEVWGTTSTIPKYCFVIEVTSPGLLVVKESRGEEHGKFANIAVLEGDQVKILTEGSNLPDCPPLVQSMLAFETLTSPTDDADVLVQLAVSMRAHRRGGSLLVVPDKSEAWRKSIIAPIRYSVSPPFVGLSALLTRQDAGRSRRWQEAVRRVVDEVAGLTAVDGATVITRAHEVLAFGAKIGRAREAPRVEQVVVTEPVKDRVAEIMPPAQLGGTRHLSAAQFVQDQRDSLALVASQDGRFTIFAWSPCEQLVHAHRVEALLL